MLFLADRSVLVDDPKDKDFAPFGDARWKIENGVAQLSREMYFALYQSLSGDSNQPGLYRQYPRDFFDLIIVDECHRGSARDDSMWREILEYFEPAYQLGMTATPLNEESRSSYHYFGLPIYQYSLRQGIEGRKKYSKTKPMQYEDLADCLAWWGNRVENEHAWRVPAATILANGCNLDIKNPNAAADLEHLPPEELVESILQKEQQIAALVAEIKAALTGVPA